MPRYEFRAFVTITASDELEAAHIKNEIESNNFKAFTTDEADISFDDGPADELDEEDD